MYNERIENLIKRKEMGDYMIPFLLGCEFMVLILIFLVVICACAAARSGIMAATSSIKNFFIIFTLCLNRRKVTK